MSHQMVAVRDDIASKLSAGESVVALESTIITHGMPYPQNVETALDVENAVREEGASPATIAVVDGHLRVGLTEDEIDRLGQAGDKALKVSRRDLPFAMANRKLGGTTVAATMILAEIAGIEVFATGGIGGVHRGASESFDISADLQELANTCVTVVCAGIKSILDLGLTLEYLETHGVPVIGYQTDTLPAFFSRESAFAVNYRLDTAEAVAEIMDLRRKLGLRGGIVVANPIPQEHSLDKAVMDAATEQALRAAKSAGVTGKETTPFLLSRVVELTESKSLEANVALVTNNARLAARIASVARATAA